MVGGVGVRPEDRVCPRCSRSKASVFMNRRGRTGLFCTWCRLCWVRDDLGRWELVVGQDSDTLEPVTDRSLVVWDERAVEYGHEDEEGDVSGVRQGD